MIVCPMFVRQSDMDIDIFANDFFINLRITFLTLLRITTVAYWKQRLTTEHATICQEITNLTMSKQKTQQALASTELPTEVK